MSSEGLQHGTGGLPIPGLSDVKNKNPKRYLTEEMGSMGNQVTPGSGLPGAYSQPHLLLQEVSPNNLMKGISSFKHF